MLSQLLNGTCVYWPKGDIDKYGQYAKGTAVELVCYWRDKNEEVISSNGETLVTKSTVILSVDIDNGGWLWQGTLATAPATPPSRNQIIATRKSSDVDNTEILYKAFI